MPSPLPVLPPDTLNLATWVEATEAEGPGWRFAIWTQGCAIRCPECVNPHLFAHKPARLETVPDMLARIDAARERQPALEGITLVGGEPFEQDVALAALCREVRARGLTVMAFTGHLREELEARGSPLLAHLDLLVDGPYVAAQRTEGRRWIGSTNQRLFFLSPAYRPDDPRFLEPNTAELRYDGKGQVHLVGFPFARLREALTQLRGE